MIARIFWFITIFGLIVAGLLYTNTVTDLARVISEINSNFFSYIPGELKLLFGLGLLGGIYTIYHNFRH